MSAFRLLLFAMLWAPPAPSVRVEVGDIDPVAIERGLELRLGEAASGWDVEVLGTDAADRVDVRLRSPGGARMQRWVTLEGETVEDRSRELASAVALIIEGHVEPAGPEEPDEPPPRTPAAEIHPIQGWMAIGPRLGVGPPSAVDLDVGFGIRGGSWLVAEHVQPMAAMSWSRSFDADLVLDGLRFGIGAAFGASVARRRLWLGAGVIPRASWTRAADRRSPSSWRSSTEISGHLQLRGRGWMAGLRAGVDLTAPPVRARGQDPDDSLRWGPARFVLGLDLGILLPPKPRRENTRVGPHTSK